MRLLITECREECDLGVTFDEKLNFDTHIQQKINKANRVLGIIKRTFSHMDKDIFLKLYKALVRPHLEYANSVWSPNLIRQSSAIEKVQRRATKLVPGLYNMSYTNRLKLLNLPTLKQRRLRGDLIQTYKIFQEIDDVKVSTIFTTCKYDKTRNPHNKIFIQHSKTNIRKKYFSNRVAPFWNALPLSTKQAPELNDFKTKLDKEKFMYDSLYTFDE